MSDKEEITALIRDLRTVAEPVGSMHSWWDTIFDLEALRDGRPTIFPEAELIAMARHDIAERKRKYPQGANMPYAPKPEAMKDE